MSTVNAGPRVALVTGAARRLGRQLASELGRSGYQLVVHYRSSKSEAQEVVEEIQGAGGSARSARADIASASEVEAMFQSVGELEGRLDLLVNNVGIYEPCPLADLDPERWDRCISANLSGAYYCCHFASDLLRESGGQIINIGYAGVDRFSAHPGATAYQVSKTGLLVLTRSLAVAMAPGVRVNMVSPGQLETSIDLPEDLPATVPLGRAGTQRDVAETVRYLVTADYVTGVNIDVAGGYRLQ